MGSILEIYRYRTMLKYMVRTELRARYKGSLIGFLWTFLNPLFLIVIYTVVFSTILRVNIPNYTIYLMSGLLPWNMFQSTILGSTTAIIRHSNLVKKIYFPRQVLPLSIVLTNTVNYLYSVLIIFIAIVLTHSNLSWSILLFPIILLIEIVLMTGFALIFSAANVYFRDIEHILTVFITVWFYLTPIVYSINLVPVTIRHWVYLNPMASIINSYIEVFYAGRWPTVSEMGIAAAWAVVVFGVGWILFGKLNKGFGEEV